jgi:Effector Associated Constant Component 1
MPLPSLQITIAVGPNATAEELHQLSRRLRDELRALDDIAVDYSRTPIAPPGSKGPGGVDAGTLIVTLSNSAVLVALAGALRSWVGRARGRKIVMRLGEDKDIIEIDGASPEDVTALLESWAAAHNQSR